MVERGTFIAFEGGEGTGKSTQARLLVAALAERGFDVVATREPGGTPGAEAIRTLLLAPPGDGWYPRAEALLFAAARSDHVDRLILPALERGAWVISDRFVDSSRAYQGGAGGLGDETIVALHQLGSGGVRPDCTVLVDVDAGTVSARLAQRDGGDSDAIGGRDAAYHAQVAASFRALAQGDPGAFRVVDGNGTPEEVHSRVLQALGHMLEPAA
ncbi:dTMP kinase [Altererythrobacter sp. H2]|uniref:dTMP kinase n=1 Tax=Altererythrobacter sp. H2 TaxID=3108391 RepID=UPI002B4C2338|nr:dTMP kinase [Altererythrobacter sp. H2]WRK94307.1 dTMP kinase [Altererythrobacter sp. H2]